MRADSSVAAKTRVGRDAVDGGGREGGWIECATNPRLSVPNKHPHKCSPKFPVLRPSTLCRTTLHRHTQECECTRPHTVALIIMAIALEPRHHTALTRDPHARTVVILQLRVPLKPPGLRMQVQTSPFYSRYATLEQASQNSPLPASHHPNGPRLHSAQARSFICLAGSSGIGLLLEKPIFSKASSFGVTSHHSIVSGDVGRGGRSDAGASWPAGSIFTADVSQVSKGLGYCTEAHVPAPTTLQRASPPLSAKEDFHILLGGTQACTCSSATLSAGRR